MAGDKSIERRTPTAPWVDLDAEMRVYRVNRRPLEDPGLFANQDGLSDDPLGHFLAVLDGVEPLQRREDRGGRRLWALGQLEPVEAAGRQVLVGTLGYERQVAGRDSRYVASSRRWVTSSEERHDSDVVPVIYDAETRLLGVVIRRGFGPVAVAEVLTAMLRRAEHAMRDFASDHEWSVEPVEDPQNFYDWVAETDRIMSLTLVARLPNPEATAATDALLSRLQGLRAGVEVRKLNAQDKRGLQGVAEDVEVQAHVTAAELAFGEVRGVGRTVDDAKTLYSQRRSQARLPVGVLVEHAATLAEQMATSLGAFAARWQERHR